MIINDSDAASRLNSPLNLINRMKNLSDPQRKNAMSLFIKPAAVEQKETKQPLARIAPPGPTSAAKLFNPFENQSEALTIIESSCEASPSIDDLSDDHDNKIQLALAHDNAITLLNNSINVLTEKLLEVKADKLPSVIAAASRTVESIRKERLEQSKSNKDRDVHYHFYTPQQKQLADYEVIEVTQ